LAQAKRKKAKTVPLTQQVHRGVREGALILFSALAVYLLVSLLSFDAGDPGWSDSGAREAVHNAGGRVGAWFADVSLYLIGYMAYLFPVMVGYSGWLVFRGRTEAGDIDYRTLGIRWAGFFLTVGAGCGLASLHFAVPPLSLPLGAGGVLGKLIGDALVGAFSFVGATLFLLALFLTGVTLFTGLSWLALMDHTGRLTLQGLARLRAWLVELRERAEQRKARLAREETVQVEKKKAEKRKPPRIEPVVTKVERGERELKEKQVPLFDPPPDTELPPLMLLDEPPPGEGGFSEEALQAMSRLGEMTSTST